MIRTYMPVVAVAGLLLLGATDARAQKPILSPRDSVEVSVEGGRIFIDYGRPSMRGRIIMGGLVPYNKWWRTGANEATSFKTSVDLLLGDSLVPAGDYTMYTLPSAHKWMLIINKQTGQWGTTYNEDLDLVRVPLEKKMMEKDLETFTISFEKIGARKGTLRLQWERTDLSVPFEVVRKSGK